MRVLDVALIGCGHMGRHHARAVGAHPESRLVAVIDVVPERARQVAAWTGAEARSDVPDGVDVVIVATPTTTHRAVGRPSVEAGRWCLIEKPLAEDVVAAGALVGPRTWVGHVERWNPAWDAAPPAWWRRLESVRAAPPSGRCRDVDVVLDLLLHDLDLVLATVGAPERITGAGRRADDGVLDEVSVELAWADRAASMTASRLARTSSRRWSAFAPGRYRTWDLSASAAPGVGDALQRQWATLVDAARGRRALPWRAEEAVAALALAERVRDAVLADARPGR